MSFYGNSFTYTAESFARIVLANLGLNRSEVGTFPEDKFDLIDTNQTATIDAESRKTGVHISSGNQWIQLGISSEIIDPQSGKKKNEFCIMHGPPARQANQPFIIPLYLPEVSEVDEKVLNQEGVEPPPILGFDKYLAFPVIKYDNAGHVVFDQNNAERAYFKMPSNPIGELTGKFNEIDTRFDAIDKNFTLPEGEAGGALSYLNTQLLNLSSGIDAKLDLFKKDTLDATLTTFKTDNLDPVQSAIDTLNARLNDTEPKLNKFMESEDKIDLIELTYSAANGASKNVTSVAGWLIANGIAPTGTSIDDILSYNQ